MYTTQMSKNGVDNISGFSARLVFEEPDVMYVDYGHYVRTETSDIDWPAKLLALRNDDFAGEDAKTNASRLLNDCGYIPVMELPDDKHLPNRLSPKERARLLRWSKRRKATRWDGAPVDKRMLERIQAMQAKIRDLVHYEVRTVASRNTKARKLTSDDINTCMVKYLKDQRADVPSKGEDFKRELHRAVADVAREAGEPLDQVMQRIAPGAPGAPPPRVDSSDPSPDEVLRYLLSDAIVYGADKKLSFDTDGTLVLSLTPREPLVALLLRAHKAMSLSFAKWATCKRCGKSFPQKRRDAKACSEKCRNYLKVTKYQAKKKALQMKPLKRRERNG